MKRVDQFYFMTNLTKKISLLVVETKFDISNNFIDYLFDLFKDVNFYNEERDIIAFNKTRLPDIILIDLNTKGLDVMNLTKSLKAQNPSANIILFSSIHSENTYKNYLDYDVDYLINSNSTIFELKEIIINCIKNMISKNKEKLLTNNNDNVSEKINCIDCMNYLLKIKSNSLNLITHYKGVPFIKKANILKVEANKIYIKIDKTHKFVFKYLNYAVASSVHLSSDIHLELLEINECDDIAVFTKAYFIDSYIQNRKTPRIEPCNKLRLLCEFDKRCQNVEILDISVNYMLISLSKITDEFNLESKVKMNLSYSDEKIFNNNFQISKNAHVKKITSCKNKYEILINFSLTQEERERFCFYIKNRTKELIMELNKS